MNLFKNIRNRLILKIRLLSFVLIVLTILIPKVHAQNNIDIYSSEQIQHKDYSGITLNILTHEKPVMGEPTELHAHQFEKLTGAKINITFIPFEKLYQELQLGLKTGKYDIVFYGSLWIADIVENLEPIPEKMLNSSQFHDVLEHYKMISKWENKYYQVPIDGDRHYFQYRTDVLESIKHQYFKEKNKILTHPETWKDVLETLEFFKTHKPENFKNIHGIVEINKFHDLLFSQFIKHAAPYAFHPDNNSGFYFDVNTMKPLINSPGFVEALKDFIALQKYYPDLKKEYGLADVIESFGKGEAIFSDCWDDPFIKAMENDSKIKTGITTSLSPGSRKAWNIKTQKWDKFTKINYVPYFAWGWTSAVSKKSKNKEAAFDYLGFFSNNENHFSDLAIGRFGVNPCRKSDLDIEFWTKNAGWDKKTAENYVATLTQMTASKKKILDLRIYQSRQYMHALSVGIYRALTGRDTPQLALDEVANKWTQLTKQVGIEKQKKAYEQIVKFENGQ